MRDPNAAPLPQTRCLALVVEDAAARLERDGASELARELRHATALTRQHTRELIAGRLRRAAEIDLLREQNDDLRAQLQNPTQRVIARAIAHVEIVEVRG